MKDDTQGLMQSSRHIAAPQAEARKVAESESRRAELTVEGILAWADAHHAAHDTWPEAGLLSGSGAVDGAPGESWKAINHALAMGLRGLPGDSSLAELLAEHRGASPPDMRPQALAEKIWAWEQEHFPIKRPRIRAKGRPYRPLLSSPEILAWVAAHHAATGEWPRIPSGQVRDAPFDVTWVAINSALVKGLRGLPGGSSITRLMAEYYEVEPTLTLERVLAWADAHHAATGTWPTFDSGKVHGAVREYWAHLDTLLRVGGRGLQGGLSVSRMLQKYRGLRDQREREPLTIDEILVWGDAHHAVNGVWPSRESGPVRDAPHNLTWSEVGAALNLGRRGLPSGWALARLWAEYRDVRPPLTLERILAWADAHHAATGKMAHVHLRQRPGREPRKLAQDRRHAREGGPRLVWRPMLRPRPRRAPSRAERLFD